MALILLETENPSKMTNVNRRKRSGKQAKIYCNKGIELRVAKKIVAIEGRTNRLILNILGFNEFNQRVGIKMKGKT